MGITANLFAQEPVMKSQVYAWDSLKVIERTQGQSRPILSQSNDNFKLIKAHVSTVFPKKRMRPEVYRQENEELIEAILDEEGFDYSSVKL